MSKQFTSTATIALLAILVATGVSNAQRCLFDLYRPACGKVCKLVCEPKKLVSIGYGSKCKQICLPCPSCPGCEHCTCCCGERKCDPCACCQPTAPLFKFCWRDWMPGGCAQVRSVKVLTKYQLEKKVRWYHWEVVNASCCGCGQMIDEPASDGKSAGSPDEPALLKPAPDGAKIGDAIAVSGEERVKLAALFNLNEDEVLVDCLSDEAAK